MFVARYGEMSGKGTLNTSCGTMYSGDFFAGNMEGKGTITFITKDQCATQGTAGF